jgi:hypothetical protein
MTHSQGIHHLAQFPQMGYHEPIRTRSNLASTAISINRPRTCSAYPLVCNGVRGSGCATPSGSVGGRFLGFHATPQSLKGYDRTDALAYWRKGWGSLWVSVKAASSLQAWNWQLAMGRSLGFQGAGFRVKTRMMLRELCMGITQIIGELQIVGRM